MQLLIVDDSPSHRVTLSGLLRLYDIHSQAACNGIDALQLIQNHTFDAILLDWIMPELDGLHTLKRLRQMPKHRDLPVIVITGCESDGIQALAMHAGADAFMTKPVEFDRLLALLDDVLEVDRLIS